MRRPSRLSIYTRKCTTSFRQRCGSFSAWSANATDGGDLSVTAGAALHGSYGLAALLDDNNNLYLTDWKPYEETRYRVRFYLDPNSIPMTSGNAHYIFYALARDATVVARIEFRYSSPNLSLPVV